MKRLIKLTNDAFGNEVRYVLKKEYENFGLYQRKCNTGFFVHQDYLITNGEIIIQCEPYNEMIKEELLDAIDNYNETKKFGFKTFYRGNNVYTIHPNGKTII